MSGVRIGGLSRRFLAFVGARKHYQVLALTLAAVSMEAIGIGMVLPLLHSMDRPAAEQMLWLAAITALVCAKAGLAYLAFERLGALRAQLGLTLQDRLQTALTQTDFAQYLSDGNARWQHAFEQVPYAVGAYQSFCGLQVSLIHASVYLLAACWVSPMFGVAALLLAACIYVGFRALHRNTEIQAQSLMARQVQLTTLGLQWLRGMRYLRATGLVDVLADERRDVAREVANGESRLARLLAISLSLREPIALVALLALVAIALATGQATLAAVLVAMVLFYRAANALLAVQQSWHGLLSQVPALDVINAQLTRRASIRTGRQLPNGFDMTLRGVSFAHGESQPLLNSVDWYLPTGRWIGLSGESGIGKSTLFDVLLGLQAPQSGRVEIGGVALDELDPERWRSSVGLVPQEPWIKADTVERNIALHAIGEASLHQLRLAKACRVTDLAATLAALPAGLATRIGEGGVELSGGERQRVALARELYREPKLLLLDEATSALDEDSEGRILTALRAEQGDMCVVHASHRPRPLALADEVWRLANGTLTLESTR